MKILITGASGTLGLPLTLQLLREHKVSVIARDPGKLSQAHVKIYMGDITDFDFVNKTVASKKPDVVIHLAAIISKACDDDPSLTDLVNVKSTENLAKAAEKSGATKFIFPSTAAIYDLKNTEPNKESESSPLSIYGKSKFAAERRLLDITQDSNLNVAVLRIFNVYGPGIHGSLINKLINSTKLNPVELIDPEHFVRDYVNINDLMKVFRAFVETKFSGFNIYNVASGHSYSTKEILQLLKENGFRPFYKITTDNSPTYSLADISRLQELIGFVPSTTLDFTGIS
jgi:nucleoside-diphosphate-sugar epimerase